MDLKSLKKLAELCRKVGIKTFKNSDIEFTLSDDQPIAIVKRSRKTSKNDDNTVLADESNTELNSLTEEQMLMWSSSPLSESN